MGKKTSLFCGFLVFCLILAGIGACSFGLYTEQWMWSSEYQVDPIQGETAYTMFKRIDVDTDKLHTFLPNFTALQEALPDPYYLTKSVEWVQVFTSSNFNTTNLKDLVSNMDERLLSSDIADSLKRNFNATSIALIDWTKQPINMTDIQIRMAANSTGVLRSMNTFTAIDYMQKYFDDITSHVSLTDMKDYLDFKNVTKLVNDRWDELIPPARIAEFKEAMKADELASVWVAFRSTFQFGDGFYFGPIFAAVYKQVDIPIANSDPANCVPFGAMFLCLTFQSFSTTNETIRMSFLSRNSYGMPNQPSWPTMIWLTVACLVGVALLLCAFALCLFLANLCSKHTKFPKSLIGTCILVAAIAVGVGCLLFPVGTDRTFDPCYLYQSKEYQLHMVRVLVAASYAAQGQKPPSDWTPLTPTIVNTSAVIFQDWTCNSDMTMNQRIPVCKSSTWGYDFGGYCQVRYGEFVVAGGAAALFIAGLGLLIAHCVQERRDHEYTSVRDSHTSKRV